MALLRALWFAILLAFGAWASSSSASGDGPAATSSRTSHLRTEAIGLRQFKHDRWTRDDGAPTNIVAIVQTPDGYLWLGSSDGLYRFDGLTFDRVPSPPGSQQETAGVSSLALTSKGELWVGYTDGGGVAVYRNGRLFDMHMPRPPLVITALFEDAKNVMWATWGGENHRLWRYDGSWHTSDDLGLPPGSIASAIPRKDGSLWVGILDTGQSLVGLFRLPPGGGRFRSVGGRFHLPELAEDPEGRLWVSDKDGARVVRGDGPASYRLGRLYPTLLGVRHPILAFDHFGGVWETGKTEGVVRFTPSDGRSPPSPIERYTVSDGLVSHVAKVPFVDREGSIWIGGDAGLDRFRRANLVMDTVVPPDTTTGISLAVTNDGVVHALSNGILYDVDGGRPPVERMRGLRADVMCRGPGNTLMLIGSKRIVEVGPKGVHTTSDPFARLPIDCAVDGSGRRWITRQDGSNWFRGTGDWHKASTGNPDGLGNAFAASHGAVAMQIDPSSVGVFDGARYLRYPVSRLGLGSTTSIDAAGRDFIVSLSRGVVLLRGGRMYPLKADRYPWLAHLRTVVQTPRGETWLYGRGVSRVSTAGLERAFQNPDAPLGRRLFDFRDGLAATQQHAGFPGVQAVAGGDGRVWIATAGGLAVIDTDHVKENPFPPPVRISSLSTAASSYRDPSNIGLQPGTTSVRLAYAALSLSIPQRVQLRYRLRGVDEDWVDPGERRMTTYSNLRPGTYRFEVIAANDAGVWNRKGAALDFVIPPTFTQSLSFKIVCVVTGGGLLWGLYRLRLRAVAGQIKLRMAARQDERSRIARELHDTLLRSVQALMLRVHLVTRSLDPNSPEGLALEEALLDAEQTVADGRRRVEGMRPRTGGCDLPDLLRQVAMNHPFPEDVSRSVFVSGIPRPLQPMALEEIEGVAKEAVVNIARHAHATALEIRVVYHRQALAVYLRDNGIGIDPKLLELGTRQGHFGLVGMRERARRLGAELILDNLPQGGAEVTLVVPATKAYIRPTLIRRSMAMATRAFRRRGDAGAGPAR